MAETSTSGTEKGPEHLSSAEVERARVWMCSGSFLLHCCFLSTSGSLCVLQTPWLRTSCLSPTCRCPGEVPAAQGGLWTLPGSGPSPESDGEGKTDSSQAPSFFFIFSCFLLNFYTDYDLHVGFIAQSVDTIISFSFIPKSKIFSFRAGEKKKLVWANTEKNHLQCIF